MKVILDISAHKISGILCAISSIMEKVYNRRILESSNLYRIFYQYYDQYEIQYPILYEKEYGYFRKAISKAVCKYLECGILENGMARVRCPKYCQDFFTFSCKARNICPSCSQKRTLLLSDWILNNVLENVSHRQWVFTVPKILNPIEFIQRICLHIPDRYESLIRYYGYYSNTSRGQRKKESQKELKISDDTIVLAKDK